MHSKSHSCPEELLVGESNILTTQQQVDQVLELQPISYQLVQEIKEEMVCYTVAFNNDGTMMAAGYEDMIKIWEFKNGKLSFTTNCLSGAQCLVFSKKQNWFASSSEDESIRCWQELKKNNWVSTRSQTHNCSCLLLNRHEDQLLSSGWDNQINVWKINCITNILTYRYSLYKHTNGVACISLNESETCLVSCGFDKMIIIWGKWNINDWKFKYQINQSIDDWGHRISFINDNIIAWLQSNYAITYIFELDNGVFKERHDQQISLKQVGPDWIWLFPSVYNKQRNILIQKHNQYIYIIRQQNDGKFKVESQPINCIDSRNYGGLTNDGQYLVNWNYQTKEFRVYLIKYE